MTPYDVRIDEIDETFTKAKHPENVKVKLWSHQLALLHRCQDYENQKIQLFKFPSLSKQHPQLTSDDFLRTHIGVIGDRVGSGKSYVILSLILNNDILQKDSSIKSYGNNRMILSFREKNINIKTNLLVIPHNLALQWENHINNFTDNIRYFMITKTKNLEYILSRQDEVGTYDLIIVTSTYFTRLAQFLTSRSFKMQRIFFDEVDNMNLPNCMTIESNFYWFVTASYGNLLYPRGFVRWDIVEEKHIWYAHGLRNAGFIKDLFLDLTNHLSKEYIKILVLKNKENFIKTSVYVPPLETNVIRCKTPVTIDILNGFVDKEVIDCLNAGDIQSAIVKLNPNHKSTEENLIQIQIDKLTRELNNTEIRMEAERQMTYDTEEERKNKLDRIQKNQNDYENKINGIRERIKNTNICNICFDDISNKTITPCCSNGFCFLCLNKWLANHKKCPLCQKEINAKDVLVVEESGDICSTSCECKNTELITNNDQKDKIENLKDLMKNIMNKNEKSKVLVYASSDMTFSKIDKVMKEQHISHAAIKGPVTHINKTIEKYKNDDLTVLLLNSRLYGSGMNLENTTDIIMFHKVDTEIEHQIIGRAQRFPRTSPLKVHYLLYENEIHG
jgi:hypothetical protein